MMPQTRANNLSVWRERSGAGRCKQCAEEVIDHQTHIVVSRRDRRFYIADGVKSELTEYACRLPLPASARATLRLEAEMRHQVLARQLQTKPLRLPDPKECHGSPGIEQDEFASSGIYNSVVLNDCQFARQLSCDEVILPVITANVQLRPATADNVVDEIHRSEPEDAPRAHPACEGVGSASITKTSKTLVHRSNETVIIQFWSAEKIIVRPLRPHQLPK